MKHQKNKDDNGKNGERERVDKFDEKCWPENICKYETKESQELQSSDVSFLVSRVRAKIMTRDVPTRVVRAKTEGSI